MSMDSPFTAFAVAVLSGLSVYYLAISGGLAAVSPLDPAGTQMPRYLHDTQPYTPVDGSESSPQVVPESTPSSLEIRIHSPRRSHQIQGVVVGLPNARSEEFRVLVYARTDKLYLFPMTDGGEGRSYSSIDRDGNWRLNTVRRFPEPRTLTAIVVSAEFDPPDRVEDIGQLPWLAMDEVKARDFL